MCCRAWRIRSSTFGRSLGPVEKMTRSDGRPALGRVAMRQVVLGDHLPQWHAPPDLPLRVEATDPPSTHRCAALSVAAAAAPRSVPPDPHVAARGRSQQPQPPLRTATATASEATPTGEWSASNRTGSRTIARFALTYIPVEVPSGPPASPLPSSAEVLDRLAAWGVGRDHVRRRNDLRFRHLHAIGSD